MMGGAIQAPIAKIGNPDLEFVAIVSAKTKVLHRTASGRQQYVVGGESGALLDADLESGTFYYVVVEPRMGLWKARFTLDPHSVTGASLDALKKDLAECEWYSSSAEAARWFSENVASMKSKAITAEKDQKKATLSAGDGTAAFIP